jgi:hypothetical protein
VFSNAAPLTAGARRVRARNCVVTRGDVRCSRATIEPLSR